MGSFTTTGMPARRTECFPRSPAAVDRPGVGQRVGIQEDDGIVVRVVFRDAVQERLCQCFRCDALAGEGGLCLLDGQFDKVYSLGVVRPELRRSSWGTPGLVAVRKPPMQNPCKSMNHQDAALA